MKRKRNVVYNIEYKIYFKTKNSKKIINLPTDSFKLDIEK